MMVSKSAVILLTVLSLSVCVVLLIVPAIPRAQPPPLPSVVCPANHDDFVALQRDLKNLAASVQRIDDWPSPKRARIITYRGDPGMICSQWIDLTRYAENGIRAPLAPPQCVREPASPSPGPAD